MHSPDIDLLRKLIQINNSDHTPIYMQLAQQLIHAIQRSYIPVGSKLPGTRLLGAVLNLHRQTIVSSYNELEAQGWIEIIPNKGSFIVQYKANKVIDKSKLTEYMYNLDQNRISNIEDNILLHPTDETSALPYHISDGKIDLRLVDLKQIVRYYSAVSKRNYIWKNIIHNYNSLQQHFHETVCSYLNLTRGLHIAKDNIFMTSQRESIVYATCRSIVKAGDIVVVAELSDYKMNMVIAQCGALVKTIPIDDEGICVDTLEQIVMRSTIKAIYVQPLHHYPTTTVLSTARRIKLVALADKYDFLIIEDDEYVTYSYDKNQPLSMSASVTNSSIVYLGTVGNHLPPLYQTGFVIAHETIIKQVSNYLKLIHPAPDIILQLSIAEMINEGELHRSLKKNLKIYKHRRDYFCTEAIKLLGCHITLEVPAHGLAVWMKFSSHISLIKLKECCAQHGLFIPKNIIYQTKNVTAIRWGFAEHTEEESLNLISQLSKALTQLLKDQ